MEKHLRIESRLFRRPIKAIFPAVEHTKRRLEQSDIGILFAQARFVSEIEQLWLHLVGTARSAGRLSDYRT